MKEEIKAAERAAEHELTPVDIDRLQALADALEEPEAATDEAATDEAATDEAATDEAATDEAATDELAEELAGFDPEVARRIQAITDELKKEFGEDNISNLLLMVALNEEAEAFLLEAMPRLEETLGAIGPKVPLYLHTEPNGDRYILRAFRPGEFNTVWLQMIGGTEEIFQTYHRQLLETIMVYPRFDEVDWEWTGEKMHTPSDMVLVRLVAEALQRVASANESVTFSAREAEEAAAYAKRRQTKPSF